MMEARWRRGGHKGHASLKFEKDGSLAKRASGAPKSIADKKLQKLAQDGAVKIGKTHPTLRLRFMHGNKYHVFPLWCKPPLSHLGCCNFYITMSSLVPPPAANTTPPSRPGPHDLVRHRCHNCFLLCPCCCRCCCLSCRCRCHCRRRRI